MNDALRTWLLCLDCAQSIYGYQEPNRRYARLVAQQLFGTAAHESNGFTARRQTGYDLDNVKGAWGLWQIERISIDDSFRRLDGKPKMALRAGHWIFGDVHIEPMWYRRECAALLPITFMQMLAVSDRLCCLFARLHYAWVPEPIPEGEQSQAIYWDDKYNKNAEKGHPEEYLRHYLKHCAVHVGAGKGEYNETHDS